MKCRLALRLCCKQQSIPPTTSVDGLGKLTPAAIVARDVWWSQWGWPRVLDVGPTASASCDGAAGFTGECQTKTWWKWPFIKKKKKHPNNKKESAHTSQTKFLETAKNTKVYITETPPLFLFPYKSLL